MLCANKKAFHCKSYLEGMILITKEIITEILNINQKDLLDISTYSKSGVLYHEFTLKPKAVSCPCCGSFSCNIKEYKTRKITHSVYHHQACILLYHARRYVCKDCGKLFMNPILLCLDLIQSVN